MVELDHIVVSAENLQDGVEWVTDRLGVAPQTGGKHAFMGTHNALLSLGPDVYLEVIAIDPDAEKPLSRQWFGLDDFSGPPQLTNWVCRSTDLERTLAGAPAETGKIRDAARGDLRWQMVVSQIGQYPFDGAFPGLISWQSDVHPCQMLDDHGIRLEQLEIVHPEIDELEKALIKIEATGTPIKLRRGAPGFRADVSAPSGKTPL